MESKTLEGFNLLLIEKEALIAMDIEQLCYDMGAATVVTVNSSTELDPEMLDGRPVDAAIMDVKLDNEWTLDFARQLLKRRIPFIVATGHMEIETFLEEFPGVAVVSKPYVNEELAEALTQTLIRARPPLSRDR